MTTSLILEDFPSNIGILAIPSNINPQKYRKELVECCVNILFETVQNLDKTLDCDSSIPLLLKSGINDRMQLQLYQIASTLQWMINSASWTNGTYEDFDKFEIQRQLKFLV